jgi:large subunit ribosomal protein L25
MDKIVMKAQRRDPSRKQAKVLRRDGQLLGVIYGRNVESTPIMMDMREASQLLKSVSSSSLLTIEVDGQEYTTLIRERQRDFIRGDYMHVDFLAVSLTERVAAMVNLHFEGEAPAIESVGGLLITGIDQVEVESLPQDLPESIVVDLSVLENIGDGIFVRDLQLAGDIEILSEPEEMIAIISAPALEEEEEEEEELDEVEGGEPEVIEKGKKDEDEEDED